MYDWFHLFVSFDVAKCIDFFTNICIKHLPDLLSHRADVFLFLFVYVKQHTPHATYD